MNLETSTQRAPARRWQTEWLRLTALSAVLATVMDAALIERKEGFFSGGFLAIDYVRSPLEAASFLAASVLADAAVAGGLVALALWITRNILLTRAARSIAALAVALGPLATANFLSYQLHQYLGDGFDLALMFDLTGRRPEELFAVASSHVGAPLLLLTTGGVCAAGTVWIVNRFSRQRGAAIGSGDRATWRWTLGLFVLGLCSTAVLRAGSDVMDNGLRRKPAGQLLGAIAELASDVDRDGFGAIARMRDPAPFDAAIFPYAIDVPGNGVDENGIGGDLPVARSSSSEADSVATGWLFRPDVVLIVLESWRADVLGTRLDGRVVTPALNDLARNGISSDLAFSHNGYTAQSRHHLFAGSLAALRHGTTLIDDFKANGYEVAYFSGQDESFGGKEYAVGFDRSDVAYDARVEPHRRYSTFATAGSLAVPLDVVRERVDAYLASRRATKPLLLYVNFHDTHFPYHHAGIETLVSSAALDRGLIAPGRRDALRATYLNTAANVDRAVGAVLRSARQHLEAPAVIVTSDHGESLYDEGYLGHGHALNDVQTRIPFIVTGLPVRLTEPFGQAELRDAIRGALATPSESAVPTLARDETKRVFQYLGTIRRPRQIGFVTTSGRTIYDFRSAKARVDGGDWRSPADLIGADRTAFLDLVHFWERLVGAQAAAR